MYAFPQGSNTNTMIWNTVLTNESDLHICVTVRLWIFSSQCCDAAKYSKKKESEFEGAYVQHKPKCES